MRSVELPPIRLCLRITYSDTFIVHTTMADDDDDWGDFESSPAATPVKRAADSSPQDPQGQEILSKSAAESDEWGDFDGAAVGLIC